jgi:hypothetical protein
VTQLALGPEAGDQGRGYAALVGIALVHPERSVAQVGPSAAGTGGPTVMAAAITALLMCTARW